MQTLDVNPDSAAPLARDNKHGAGSSALGADWYILRCGGGLDFLAEEAIRESGWGIFLPRERKWRRSFWRRRPSCAAAEYPRFPGYLFIAVAPPHWPDFAAWPFVAFARGILGMGGVPVPLAAGEIERLMAEDGTVVPHTASVPTHKALVAGQYVRVTGGPFRDFVVEIESIGEDGARASVPILGRQADVVLPLTILEAA